MVREPQAGRGDSGKPTAERRRYARSGIQLRAVLSIDCTVYPIARLLDIGCGGCRFALPEVIADGTPCRLRLLMSPQGDEPALTLDGRIQQRPGGVLAVEFTAIAPAERQRLQQLIRYHASGMDIKTPPSSLI